MQSTPGFFQRQPADGDESWYRIDQEGINHEGYYFYRWAEVVKVEAWVTDGDGNYGFDEWWHLRLTFRNGDTVHIPEIADISFYHDLQDSLLLFLPGINSLWQEAVRQDYHARFYPQSWWRRLLLPYPNKPVVFRR